MQTFSKARYSLQRPSVASIFVWESLGLRNGRTIGAKKALNMIKKLVIIFRLHETTILDNFGNGSRFYTTCIVRPLLRCCEGFLSDGSPDTKRRRPGSSGRGWVGRTLWTEEMQCKKLLAYLGSWNKACS